MRNPLETTSESRAAWDESFGRELRLDPRRSQSGRPVRGFVLHEGPSVIGGLVMRAHSGRMQHVRSDVPLVVIAVFGDTRGANVKTGRMIQTYILVRDVDPLRAVDLGLDEGICGFCPHRLPGGQRTCYVRLDTSVLTVWRTYRRGGYPRLAPEQVEPVFRHLGQMGYVLRMGTYGDPAAVPFDVWARVLGLTPEGEIQNLPLAGTCYTHQWMHSAVQPLRAFCMASVDTESQRVLADRMGWRSFQPVSTWRPRSDPYVGRRKRFRPPTKEELQEEYERRRAAGQTLCPASPEFEELRGVPVVTCEQCRLCCGQIMAGKKSVWIPIHGMGRSAAIKAARRQFGEFRENPCPCYGACGCPVGSANPGDEELRRLERAARFDPAARDRLARELRRRQQVHDAILGKVDVARGRRGQTRVATGEGPQEVRGYSYGGWSVTRSVDGRGWRVTHVESGGALGGPLRLKREAEAVLREIHATGYSFSGSMESWTDEEFAALARIHFRFEGYAGDALDEVVVRVLDQRRRRETQ